MGEIKSTLDLVMEKTRHMTLSAEEKARQQKADFEKRLQGLLQQYEDQVLSTDELRKRIEQLQAELKVYERQLVAEAVLMRIDPDSISERQLDMVSSLVPSARIILQKILESHREKHAEFFQAGKQLLLDKLAGQHGIKGSAVLPNIEKDPLTRQHLIFLQHETQKKIKELSKQIP